MSAERRRPRGLRGLTALLFALLWMLAMCGPLGALIDRTRNQQLGPVLSTLICATGTVVGFHLCLRAFKARTLVDALGAVVALLLLLPTLLLMALSILIAITGGIHITPFM